MLLVGGGPIALGKGRGLAEAGAAVRIVSPAVLPELADLAAAQGWTISERPFDPADLDDAIWLVVSAAPPDVNREVAAAAQARRVFVVAVDDRAAATAYGGSVIRRGGVTVALSTEGAAPALTGLLREGLDALLPAELDAWVVEARRLRPSWRAESVPMSERRPRLLAALNALYAERALVNGLEGDVSVSTSVSAPAPAPPLTDAPAPTESRLHGRVTLVGAGPGDPELLTLRAVRRLAEADLVLYDALSSEAMRRFAPHARWFFVGKRACRASIAQDVLNRIIVREALRGRHVVRLKCGDPFVFGRGGEEALAAVEAGLPCEVVPGISSAVAAPALAGIPITHRGMASGFAVISGHHEATYRPLLAALPRQGMTVVVLMGLRQRAAIAATMIELGWPSQTPSAIVVGAATPAAWRWTGTLADLPATAAPASAAGAPGLLVIGDVVALAGTIEASTFVAVARGQGGGTG